jgi:DNA replication factor GINS
MYSELYEVWRRELESSELERLPSDFYSRIADYLRKLKEEGRMLDKRTMKASLLKKETRNVKRMVHGLIRARYKKLIRKTIKGEKVQSNVLTVEEEKIYTRIFPFAEAYRDFAKNILRGYAPKISLEKERKRTVLRFLKDVPTIIGADMKPYGPFKVEDVASLPNENAKILIKQNLAEKVEAN